MGWWALIVLRQAERIAQLSRPSDATAAAWSRTKVMLLGEIRRVPRAAGAHRGARLALLARARVRAMQAFFAAVTHGLRTPLTSIRLQAEAIAEGR
ncbi:MAG: histidine kinase dimerization/phospho-acceptor domain-containing protein [Steroidobacteraceae bacterium]